MIRNETASPVIVVAFNGTNDPRGQQELAGIDAGLRERFPENEIRWALTSPWMIRHLQAIKQREIFPPPPRAYGLPGGGASRVSEGFGGDRVDLCATAGSVQTHRTILDAVG